MATIETIKIHPAIGIARLGNSPTGFFIGSWLHDNAVSLSPVDGNLIRRRCRSNLKKNR